MVPLLRFAGVMAAQRVVRGWRLEAALFGGILLAVALMSSGVIFSDLLANAALHRALAEAPPEEVNFWARSFSSQDDPPEAEGRRQAFQSRQDFVERQVIEPFRPYLKEHSRYLETATFFFQGHPQLELDRDIRPRGAVYYITGVSGRVRVLEGRWPEGPGAPGQPLDVAVDWLGAKLLGLGVGDGMEIFPATSFDDYPPLQARIAAIYERTDSSDEFWQGLDSAASRKDDRWTLIPLFAAEDALIEQALGAYPSLYADITWRFFPDKANMRAGDVDEAQIVLAGIERSISGGLKNSSYSIRLDTLLRRFEEQLLLGRLPLFMALFLVTGILIYYLALVAGLVVRSRTGEIAMLKSRGATVWQLGVLGLGEGLLLALPAVAVGPFLALGAVKLLGAAFFELSGASGDWAGVPAGLSGYAFLVGIAGGGLSAAVFAGGYAGGGAAQQRGGVASRGASAGRQFVAPLLLGFGAFGVNRAAMVAIAKPGGVSGAIFGRPGVEHRLQSATGAGVGNGRGRPTDAAVFPVGRGGAGPLGRAGGAAVAGSRLAAFGPRSYGPGAGSRAGDDGYGFGGDGQRIFGDSGTGPEATGIVRRRGRSALAARRMGRPRRFGGAYQ